MRRRYYDGSFHTLSAEMAPERTVSNILLINHTHFFNIMKKQVFLLTAALALSGSALAESLTPEQALARMQLSQPMRMLSATQQMELVHTTRVSEQSEAALYVFDNGNNNGFVILSADDCAAPVLGYMEHGNFDINNCPPALAWWLEEYANEIEYGRQHQSAPYNKESDIFSGWASIEPMVATRWDQAAPYNNSCPKSGNRTTYTGCVATAMAQAMKYFEYPVKGTGEISYYCSSLRRTLRMDLESQNFDWDNMLDIYSSGYTDQEASAVAYLMQACGYGVNMNYGVSASGASSALISDALIRYFGYDGNISYLSRVMYPSSEWNRMVYDNLKNVGPLIYNGNSAAGGHSFICDGYDKDGYFHFNWGWSGMSDGFFRLNALNPSSQGIGGYAGGYNFSQDAVFGIQPPTGEPVKPKNYSLTMNGSLDASATPTILTLRVVDYENAGWLNNTPETLDVQLGIKVESVDGGSPTYKAGSTSAHLQVNPGHILLNSSFSVTFPSVSSGTYKVSVVNRPYSSNSDADWIPVLVPYGLNDYVLVTKTSASLRVEIPEIPTLKVSECIATSDIFYGYPARMQAKISNNSAIEVTEAVQARLLINDKIQFSGGSILLTMEPGENGIQEWVTRFSPENGAVLPTTTEPCEYTLELYDVERKLSLGTFGKVTMKRTSAAAAVRLRGLSIVDADTEMVDGFGAVYQVTDARDFKVNVRFDVTQGYLASPLIAAIYGIDSNNELYEIMETEFDDMIFSGAGSSLDITQTLDFYNAQDNKVYYLYIYYVYSDARNSLGSVRFQIKDSGVEIIETDNVSAASLKQGVLNVSSAEGIASVDAYTLDGCCVGSAVCDGVPEFNLNLQTAAPGVIIVRVVSSNGKIETFKFIN